SGFRGSRLSKRRPNSDLAAITSGRKRSGDGLSGADADGARSSGEREHREPYREWFSGSRRAPHTGTRTLAIRRGGRPGPATARTSFLPVLAETLLVQPRRIGPHPATRSQRF